MRYFTTKSVNVFRDHPWAMFAVALTGGSVSTLLFRFDGYTTSAAVAMGVAVAAVTYALFLIHRWVGERLDAKRSGDLATRSLTGDAG